MISSGINLVMTVIGFAVSTMFIVFVCTRLICARIQLNSSRRSFAIASRSDLSILERSIHGLEPISLSNFPTKKYSDEFFSAADDTQCTVCLADYHHEDMLRILPYCGHSFHASCIDIWLLQHATCPVCRVSLRNFSDKKRIMQPLFSSALRMHRGAASYNGHSSHCPLSRENCPTHPGVRHRLDPVREDNAGSEDRVVAEVTESVIITVEDGSSNQISGDKTRKQQLESPSNDGQVSSLS